MLLNFQCVCMGVKPHLKCRSLKITAPAPISSRNPLHLGIQGSFLTSLPTQSLRYRVLRYRARSFSRLLEPSTSGSLALGATQRWGSTQSPKILTEQHRQELYLYRQNWDSRKHSTTNGPTLLLPVAHQTYSTLADLTPACSLCCGPVFSSAAESMNPPLSYSHGQTCTWSTVCLHTTNLYSSYFYHVQCLTFHTFSLSCFAASHN